MNEIKEIFNSNELVRTSCREEIIKAIIESPNPLTEDDIKATISGNFDRTTFYRTIKTLINKGLLHKIVIDNTLVKYAINNSKNNQHAHFYCKNCNKVFCLPEVKYEYTGLFDSYIAEESQLIIRGYCSNCN